jgi:hypothetical protein
VRENPPPQLAAPHQQIADPIRLDLTVCQAQDSMGMARMSDPKHLNLTVSQVQDNYHPSMACLKK